MFWTTCFGSLKSFSSKCLYNTYHRFIVYVKRLSRRIYRARPRAFDSLLNGKCQDWIRGAICSSLYSDCSSWGIEGDFFSEKTRKFDFLNVDVSQDFPRFNKDKLIACISTCYVNLKLNQSPSFCSWEIFIISIVYLLGGVLLYFDFEVAIKNFCSE